MYSLTVAISYGLIAAQWLDAARVKLEYNSLIRRIIHTLTGANAGEILQTGKDCGFSVMHKFSMYGTCYLFLIYLAISALGTLYINW